MIYLFNDTEVEQWGLKEKNEKFVRIFHPSGNPNFGIDVMKPGEQEIGFTDEHLRIKSSISVNKVDTGNYNVFYDYKHFSPFIKQVRDDIKRKTDLLLLSVDLTNAHVSNIYTYKVKIISHSYNKDVLNLILSFDDEDDVKFSINFIANDQSFYNVIRAFRSKRTGVFVVKKFINLAPLKPNFSSLTKDYSNPETHKYHIGDFRPNKPINTVIYNGEFEEVVKDILVNKYKQDLSKFNLINLDDEEHRKLLKDCIEVKHITAASYYVDMDKSDVKAGDVNPDDLMYLDKFKIFNIITRDEAVVYLPN